MAVGSRFATVSWLTPVRRPAGTANVASLHAASAPWLAMLPSQLAKGLGPAWMETSLMATRMRALAGKLVVQPSERERRSVCRRGVEREGERRDRIVALRSVDRHPRPSVPLAVPAVEAALPLFSPER